MNQTEDPSLVLKAAESWKQHCLINGGAMFSEEPLWKHENFEELRRTVIDKPDYSKGSFDDKLKIQLSTASSPAVCLCAEIRWLYYLIVSQTKVNSDTKLDKIKTTYSMSDESFPKDHWALGEVLKRGPVNPGSGYFHHQWLEFKFIVVSMYNWTRYSAVERDSLVSDPWKFASWLESQPEGKQRMFRHALLYLLYPSVFIACMFHEHKRSIVREFNNNSLEPSIIDGMDPIEVDRLLLSISQRLQRQYDLEHVDFFDTPLKEKWQAKGTLELEDSLNEKWYRSRFNNKKVWVVAPGTNAYFWTDFLQSGQVRIGYDSKIGDLRNYEKREDIHNKLVEYGQGNNPVNQSLALWQFLYEVEPGDFLIAKQGKRKLVGWGQVSGDYFFDLSNEALPHVRTAKWYALDEPVSIEKERQLNNKTLTRAVGPKWLNWLKYAFDLMDGMQPQLVDDQYDIDQALGGLFLDRFKFQHIVDSLASRKNLILQGPPGVGKTFVAKRIAYCLMGREDPRCIKMVQFHQSYAYEDFVQGWRPTESGGFVLRDGVFLNFCREAAAHPERRFVLIVDEINRGNLSRIFGELLMLIEADKRGSEYAVALTYGDPDKPFSVPDNLYILGLMNTADRSLAMVDYALRRRFAFETLQPAFGTREFREYLLETGTDTVLVDRITSNFTELNAKICEDKDLGAGFQIGHSYFVPEEKADETWYQNILDTQIAPLIREYWFDRPKEVEHSIEKLRQ